MAAKAGRLQIQLEMQVAQLQRDLDRATRQIDNAAGSWKKSFTSVFTGTLASDFVQRLGAATAQTIQDLGDIADKSQALGDTAEMFQRLAYAADQSGVSMDAVTSASNRLQKQLGEAADKSADALGKLGLSIADVRRMGTGDAFVTVAGRLGEIHDKAEQAAIGSALFGKGFSQLLPMVSQGEDALRRMTQQAVVASDAAVQAADEYGDAIAAMQGAVKVFIAEALAPLLPLLTQSAKEFTNVGANAAGAADGIDRSTSSARRLGEILANSLQSLMAFRDLMNGLNQLARTAGENMRPFKWPWESERGEGGKSATQSLEDITNAWSRMTTHFSGVTATVDTTAELATATRAVADATEQTTRATTNATRARAASVEEKQKELDLDTLLIGAQQRTEEIWQRTERLLIDQAMAQEELNGASREELEIMQARIDGYTETQIRILEQTQAIRAAGDAQAEHMRQQAEEAQRLSDTLSMGLSDIFYSATQGAEETKDAVAQLVIELAALYLQMLALNTLKQFNAGGSWGFQGVAKGGVFDQRGMVPFAQGGIVRSATPFVFGGGQLGVMGEAGPEAVLPLGRDSMGRLGVRGGGGVNVNVHNYGGASVSVDQRGQDIAIIIDQVRGVVANDFARGGNKITTAFEGAYGVRR